MGERVPPSNEAPSFYGNTNGLLGNEEEEPFSGSF